MRTLSIHSKLSISPFSNLTFVFDIRKKEQEILRAF